MSQEPNGQYPARTAARRREADAALEKSSRFFSTLARVGPVGIFRTDAQGGCVYVSERWCEIAGMTPDQALDRGWAQAIHPDDRERVVEAWYASARDQQKFAMEYRVQKPNGETLWVEGQAAVERDVAGAVVGYVGAITDITERKQAEQKLRDSLAEKEVLMREIHHRVKNNLQMMSALLELQSGYVKDEKVLGYFKASQQRIQSMAMIHEQLYRNNDLAQIDFADFLRSLMGNLRGQFRGRCSQVNVRINAQACSLLVDVAIPCGLVVNELVSNAFKHAYPEGRAGELRISLQCSDDGKVALEVADDGVGLPPGLDLRRGKSFGLRVITLMVEEQLHGKLRVESDHGTRVVCEIGVPQ